MASVFKKKGRDGKPAKQWTGRYKDMHGKWVTFKGWPDKSKTMAHAVFLEAEHGAVRRGEKIPPRRQKPVAEVVEEYLAWGRIQGGRRGMAWAPKHANARSAQLRWWIERLKLEYLGDLQLAAVEKVCAGLLKGGLSPKTVNGKVECLKALCQWAIRREYLTRDPLVGLGRLHWKPKAPHRALTEAEVKALLEAAPPRRRIQYLTALATGFRVGELRKIRAKDLDMNGPWLCLAAEFTKNRKEARQPIPVALANLLKPMATERPPDCPLLEVAATNSNRPFFRDAKKAGIEIEKPEGRATWHSLRKTYVTLVTQSGADLKTIMELARHSSAALSLGVYAAKDEGRLRAAMELVSPMIHGETMSSESTDRGPSEGNLKAGIEPDQEPRHYSDIRTTNKLEAMVISQLFGSSPVRDEGRHDTSSPSEDVPHVSQLDIDPAAQMWLMADRFRGVKS